MVTVPYFNGMFLLTSVYKTLKCVIVTPDCVYQLVKYNICSLTSYINTNSYFLAKLELYHDL